MQTAMVVVEAAILALLIVGGFWIRQFVTQQLAAKDAIIRLREARVRQLEVLAAPRLMQEVETLAKGADKMAQRIQELRTRADDAERAAVGKWQAGIVAGLAEGAATLQNLSTALLVQMKDEDFPAIKAMTLNMVFAIGRLTDSIASEADRVLKGEDPAFDNWSELDERVSGRRARGEGE